MITENLSTLKINKLSQEQYDRVRAAGNLDETALYLVEDETNRVIASGKTADGVIYRRWSDGSAECWMQFKAEDLTFNGGVSFTKAFVLPFAINIDSHIHVCDKTLWNTIDTGEMFLMRCDVGVQSDYDTVPEGTVESPYLFIVIDKESNKPVSGKINIYIFSPAL